MQHAEGNIHGTGEFVSDTGRAAYWEAAQRELDLLIDPNTGLLKEEFQELRPGCPVCLKPDQSRVLFVKEGFVFHYCTRCKAAYVNPILKEDALQENYELNESQDLWVDVLMSQVQRDADIQKFTHLINQINTLLPFKKNEPTQILDVGCSIGTFLGLTVRAKYFPLGLELNQKALAVARELVPNLIQNNFKETVDPTRVILEGTLEQYAGHFTENPVDVITYLEVLEHIPDPFRELQLVRNSLKPGGIVVIVVPNLGSASARMLQKDCRMFGGRNHLNYFTQHGLQDLLKHTGFVPIHWETMISDANTIWNWINFEPPYEGNRIAPDHVKDWILSQGLGYKLVCFAR